MTRFIDDALLPFENGLRNVLMKISGSQIRYLRKVHGFRRSRGEIIAIAKQDGFRLSRVIYGGYGVELTRSSVMNRLGLLMKMATKADPFLKLFNNITLFEFVMD